jgi:hypothetical protein
LLERMFGSLVATQLHSSTIKMSPAMWIISLVYYLARLGWLALERPFDI